MKIRPLEAELFHADEPSDGRTDRHDEADSCCSHSRFETYPNNPTLYYMTNSMMLRPYSVCHCGPGIEKFLRLEI
jgi:hypothetical protein